MRKKQAADINKVTEGMSKVNIRDGKKSNSNYRCRWQPHTQDSIFN